MPENFNPFQYKSYKEIPKEAKNVSHRLLVKGGYVFQTASGSFSLLPLGKKVEEKIRRIITEEMNLTGAQELLMPLLHPKSIWNETGRWEKARDVMYQFKKDDKNFWSESILRRLEQRYLKSQKASDSAKSRWEKANALKNHYWLVAIG